VRLSGITLHLKRLVSSQIIAGRPLKAVSDGAFAVTRMNAQDRNASSPIPCTAVSD